VDQLEDAPVPKLPRSDVERESVHAILQLDPRAPPDPALRTTSTVDGLARLAERGHLDRTTPRPSSSPTGSANGPDLRYLLTGAPATPCPSTVAEAERLARLMGYTHRPVTELRDDYRRLTRRARPWWSGSSTASRADYRRPAPRSGD